MKKLLSVAVICGLFAVGCTTEAPKSNKAPTPAPKPEDKKGDAPKADAPKADAPKADAPKADAPKPEEKKPEEKKGDAPVSGAAKKDK